MSAEAKEAARRRVENASFATESPTSSVLRVVFGKQTSFAQLSKAAELLVDKTQKCEVSVASVKNSVVLNARFGNKRSVETSTPTDDTTEPFLDRVDKSIESIKKSTDGASEAELAAAQALLYKVETLRSLDGVCERAVQSFGLFRRSLDARVASAPKARALVLALRINTATPVSFSHLKSVLGSSWEDGALTTDGSLDGLEDVELPTSAEAQIGIKSGNYPLTVLTRIVVA